MNLWDRIRADFSQNKAIFWLKFIISIVMLYCSVQLIFILIAYFRRSEFTSTVTLYPFFIVLLTGVMYLIRLYQISFDKQSPQFKPLWTNVIANFALSALLLFTYFVSNSA